MALIGLLVVAAPFISVERVGTKMLAELPEVNGADFIDERVGWRAMFDDEFVVARRTYSGVAESFVSDALRQDGFDTTGMNGFSRTCCADFDAVWVVISAPESGTVVAELRPADVDWQSSWPVVALIGLTLSTVGIVLMARPYRRDPLAPSTQQHPTSV